MQHTITSERAMLLVAAQVWVGAEEEGGDGRGEVNWGWLAGRVVTAMDAV